MSALALESVAVSLGGTAVLRGVDLQLAAGELLALAGRNGTGKTTLLRVASRVLAPDAGHVSVEGLPAARYSRRELARRIAVVGQETAIPFAFSVAEVVLMGRAPHLGMLGFESAADRRAAGDALERLGIEHLAARSVLEISGGERQLVMIARALSQDAPILLLDEPTAHLDVSRGIEVLGLARALAAEGRAVLTVSHDLALVARLCDRIALLADGRIVAAGEPAEVLTRQRMQEVFDLDADIGAGPAGEPLITPRLARGAAEPPEEFR